MKKNSTFPKKYLDPRIMPTEPFWENALSELVRPQAILLRGRVAWEFPMGLDPEAKGVTFSSKDDQPSTVDHFLQAKLKYPNALVLQAVGDFWEAIGVDACIFAEAGSLNAMGGTTIPKCGTPLTNGQALINAVLDYGFQQIVMIEQASIPNSTRKSRFISQVITQDNPVYLYNGSLDNDRFNDFPETPPVFYLTENRGGYQLYELMTDTLTVFSYLNFTLEAAFSVMGRFDGRTGQIYLDKAVSGETRTAVGSFVNSRNEHTRGKWRSSIVAHCDIEPINDDKIRMLFARHLLNANWKEITFGIKAKSDRPYPIHFSTAEQIGLIPSRHMPFLTDYLLPKDAHSASKSLIQRILLEPPAKKEALLIGSLLDSISGQKDSVIDLPVLGIAKIIRTVTSGEANAAIFLELKTLLERFSNSTKLQGSGLLNEVTHEDGKLSQYSSLLKLAGEFSGIPVSEERVAKSSAQLLATLKRLLDGIDDQNSDLMGKSSKLTISNTAEGDFVRSHLSEISSLVSPLSSPKLKPLLLKAKKLGAELATKAHEDIKAIAALPSAGQKYRSPYVFFDSGANRLLIKFRGAGKYPSMDILGTYQFESKGLGKDRFSTKDLDLAHQKFFAAINEAKEEIKAILKKACQDVSLHSTEIITLITAALIHKTLYQHSLVANRAGWSRNVIYDRESQSTIKGVFPFWLNQKESAANDFDHKGMSLLFGGNLGGKSTFLRALVSSFLLASSGLYFPARSVILPYSHPRGFYLRTGAHDDPKRGLSGFSLECLEVGSILSELSALSKNSNELENDLHVLLYFDELGKGTDSRSAVSICAAILNELSNTKNSADFSGVTPSGILASHWHELASSPIKELLKVKSYSMKFDENGPTFKISEGGISDSSAFYTARRYDIPETVVAAAERVYRLMDDGTESTNRSPGNSVFPIQITAPKDKDSCLGQDNFNRPKITNILGEERSRVTNILTSVVRKKGTTVETDSVPPLSLGHSLYIIQLKNGFYYIGETSDFSRRFKEHQKSKGVEWAHFFSELDITIAKKLEKELITILGKIVPLFSDYDGE